MKVRAKKHLGQHFLTDENIAHDIAYALSLHKSPKRILEIGPGTGMLTKYLLDRKEIDLYVSELDKESVQYLQKYFKPLDQKIMEGDFLKMDLIQVFQDPIAIIGNFPYNISSQIFFHVLDFKNHVTEVVCMLQKEVAERLCAKHGNKTYGILSVFLQAYYDMEYLFTVPEHVFDPPPKVKSGVIRLKRNETLQLACDEKMFRIIVKQGFNNRRKTLRNALKPLNLPLEMTQDVLFDLRAEQLSVAQFVALTLEVSALPKS